MKRFIPLLAGFFLPMTPVLAQDGPRYVCQYGDLSRRVEVHYAMPGQAVPCEVRYFKDTEDPGNTRVLWNAQAETGFCEARAAELVDKLRGWGWTCAEAGGADDTGDVLPAEPAVTPEPAEMPEPAEPPEEPVSEE